MAAQLERLVAEAMLMSAVDRAAFAQMLLDSLQPDSQCDEAWEQEVERRVADIENGMTQLIPIEAALLQVRSLLK